MAARSPQLIKSVDDAAEMLWRKFNGQLRVATPLGLGKPNQLLNALYAQARASTTGKLTLFTALSLDPPAPKQSLERRFMEPFRERHWGADYPVLEYARDARQGRLPENVRVHEFYLQAGSGLRAPRMQQDYQSLNYTHVAGELARAGVDAVVQLVARRGGGASARYSLSCNPDVTLDLADLFREQKKPLFVVGVVHPQLPFVGGEAEVPAAFFDALVEDPGVDHEIFALPRTPIDEVDHAIGFHASRLVVDDGTLQIGIGSLSDAIVSSLLLRHRQNTKYRELVRNSLTSFPHHRGMALSDGTFEKGLYGLSELVTDGFMHLREAGILKREVIDDRAGVRTYLHGAFYLGSRALYDWLRTLEGEDFTGLRMGRVSKVNDLYDPHEVLLRKQRKNPRFINTCMQVTLLGGAASDTLSDGRVVSGVGGQYNFVAMSHELPGSRSILLLRSTREEKGRRRSNIVASHGHLTIPRHLRDIIITEYGIADVRGKTDQETVEAILAIADSQFQDELADAAIQAGKLPRGYRLPNEARNNHPEKIARFVRESRPIAHVFSSFPFGSDFTPTEERLVHALTRLKARVESSRLAPLALLLRSFSVDSSQFTEELERMGLTQPTDWRTRLERRLLLTALARIE